ncbi:MAG: DUF1566 domain-containing protein [Thiolinea sp.]
MNGNTNTTLTVENLDNGTKYFFVVTATAIEGGNTVYSLTSNQVSVTPQAPVAATGQLNDTGITLCGSVSGIISNSLDCDAVDDLGNPLVPGGQDGHYGRDVTANDDSDGHAGFSFTKLAANGDELAAGATEWSCVKDNVTGLIWEVKTDDGGLHDKDDRFTWYDTDTTRNGGFAGYANNYSGCASYDTNNEATWCNTQAFVARVNSGVGLCGANDWRMPTREELRSLVSYDRVNPAIDADYFPNTVSSVYWSSSPYANRNSSTWALYFGYGSDSASSKGNLRSVRLVRSGQ